jgi:hypothetical protein
MQIFLLLVRVVTAEGDVGHVRREERVKGTHDCSVVALAKVTNVDWVLSTICGNIYWKLGQLKIEEDMSKSKSTYTAWRSP